MLQADCECILYHGTVSEIKQVDVTKGKSSCLRIKLKQLKAYAW